MRTRKRLSRISEITPEKIIEVYNKVKNLTETSRQLKISYITLKKLVKENNIVLEKFPFFKEVTMEGFQCNLLKVISREGLNKDGRRLWKCECVCGNIITISGKELRRGQKSCGCILSNYTDILPGYIYYHARYTAQRKNRVWNITYKFLCELWIKQNGLCALTGRQLYICPNKSEYHQNPSITTASLDRIDSSKGYTEDNVQWVHKIVNRLKGNLSDEDFILFCKEVVDWKNNNE